MPNPNAVVSSIIRIEPALDRAPAELLRAERGLSITLADGRSVRLDPANARSPGLAVVLDGLRTQRLMAYLEIDPAGAYITRLLIPHVTYVIGVRETGDGTLEIALAYSQARHLLRRSLPDYAEIAQRLREAQRSGAVLVITEDDAHDIIDVRAFASDPGGPLPPPPRPTPVELWPPLRWLLDWLRRFWYWQLWPWWWFGCISFVRAQQVFNAMSATSCAPLTVPAPCIPFLYPDDGCWGRAHEMCRLMIAMGESPRKVWIQGGLHVSTKNNPTCNVYWGWHVAPTLCVRGPWFFWRRTMVIDPSLFTMPVPEATWKGVQGDPAASLTPSAASIFYLWGSVTDPTYTQTNQVLATYRLKLQNRAIQLGAPPYANCP